MKFTVSWLKKHLQTNAQLENILSTLTNLGMEVEETINYSEIYNPFIIAEIEETLPHPNAEKLKICKVHNGKETLQIVCGAENARAGIKVVLAPVKSKIPINNMVIKPCKIRGIESNGMLCSVKELCLGENHEGIMELPDYAQTGQKFSDFAGLNETIIDISITPNRGDLISVYGIARDLSATNIGKLNFQLTTSPVLCNTPTPIDINIEEQNSCYEFLGRYISGVKNFEATGEAAQTLKLLGSNPKSMLVALSNYSMIEFGRPNHIYDADKIDGSIIVRKAKNGEKFIALGGEELVLDEEILVIADDTKVLSVAGVIGGELSCVDENTKNVFIEVANFNPIDIARSGRKLNINTDSRYRFERRVDFATSEFFIEHLTQNILDKCGGNAHNVINKKGNNPNYISELNFNFELIEKVSGFKIEHNQPQQILESLGFVFNKGIIYIPSYRQGDIVHKTDLVEEVLRVYGLENIPSSEISITSSQLFTHTSTQNDLISERLRSRMLNEVISWSFMDENIAQNFGFNELIKLQNPISQELSVMRPSIIPNLLGFAHKNFTRGFNSFGLFENGHVFGKQYPNLQTSCIAVMRVGSIGSKNIYKEERVADFFDLKADIFAICETLRLNPEKLSIIREAPLYYHPGKSAAFKLGDKLIAYAGEIHPKTLKTFDITNTSILCFEIFLDNIPQTRIKHAKPKLEISDLQPVSRDFAFLINQEIEAYSLVKTIKTIDKNIISDVTIFDIYDGKGVPENKKSVALNVKLQPIKTTMLDSEIEVICNNITKKIESKYNAQLRM